MQMSISDAWNSVHELEQENGRGHSLVPSSLPRCIGYQDVYVDERTWLPSRPRRRRRDVDSGRESANRWKKKKKRKRNTRCPFRINIERAEKRNVRERGKKIKPRRKLTFDSSGCL